MKKYYLFANWKMAQGVGQGVNSIKFLESKIKKLQNKKELVICIIPSAESLGIDNLIVNNLKLGAQNISEFERGSYTGEVSILNLKELGIQYVLVGHSERRIYFNENNELVNKKIKLVLKNKLKVIFCLGEDFETRKKGNHFKFIRSQIISGFKNINKKDLVNVIIAYEPIWAISGFQKGKKKISAKKEDVVEMIKYIKKIIKESFGINLVNKISIIYGGSINLKNVDKIFTINENQGGLIGSASLDKNEFLKIINSLIKNKTFNK